MVAVVVGSDIQATELSHDVGVQLLANSLATVFGPGVLILLLGPVSGAHSNPVVTLAERWTGRKAPKGLGPREVAAYIPAQIAGAIGGAVRAARRHPTHDHRQIQPAKVRHASVLTSVDPARTSDIGPDG